MKTVLVTALLVFALTSVYAQEGLGLKAGFNSVAYDAGAVTITETGYYFGAGHQIELSEKFDIEPTVLYSAVNKLSSVYVPILLKYNISEDFSIQAGPQVNYIVEKGFSQGALGIDIALGAGYTILKDLCIEARYGLQVSRDFDGADINTLTIGLGYRLRR